MDLFMSVLGVVLFFANGFQFCGNNKTKQLIERTKCYIAENNKKF